jgi:hypothetical protein
MGVAAVGVLMVLIAPLLEKAAIPASTAKALKLIKSLPDT